MTSSLDLVLKACGGSLLVAEAKAAGLVGLAIKTFRHHRCAGVEILPTRLVAGRRLVDARDIAAFLDGDAVAPPALPSAVEAVELDRPKRGPGRPRKVAGGAA